MTHGSGPLDRDACLALDAQDPLAWVREEFELPAGTIYLDGNSLGPLPSAAPARVQEVVTQEWGAGLIRSWNDAGWFDKPRTIGDRIAPLIGASAGTVVVGDTTSVNLFKALVAALRMRPERDVIVSEAGNFPTDLYMIQGASELIGGYEQRLIGDSGPELVDVLDERVAVVVLSQVDYRTGRMHAMAEVTRQAHDVGALVIWDLCHSAGALPLSREDCEAAFAIGCTYKYLNGGPGAPAFVHVASRHQGVARQPLTGWHGHQDPFAFTPDYKPAEGISHFIISTPPVLSYAPLESSLDIWEKVSLDQVRTKSLALSGLFIDLVDAWLGDHVEVVTPREAGQRGSQVSLRHPQGYAVVQALIEAGVIGDFRAPDLMRFGFTPLYLGHTEVHDAVATLRRILGEGTWEDQRFHERAKVT
ncbi:MAG: kynureninase [Nocardioides sp.]|nr:kynureninase [Nocardioides sp.]